MIDLGLSWEAGSLALTAAAAGWLWLAAWGHCHQLIEEQRLRAQLRARAARQVERVRFDYEAGTARIAAALAPLLTTDPGPATAGFGDALVFEERLSVALRADEPAPADLGPEDFG